MIAQIASAAGAEQLAGAAAALASGLAAGAVFYGGLWWNVRLLHQRRHWLKSAVLTLARAAVAGVTLVALAHHGPVALAAATIGLVLARHGACRLVGGVR